MHRDEIGRVYKREHLSSSGSPITEQDAYFEYDKGNGGIGKLSLEWKGDLSSPNLIGSSLTYDFWGRVTSNTKVINDSMFKTEFSYDMMNRTKRITYPSNVPTFPPDEAWYYYDRQGNVERIWWSSMDTTTITNGVGEVIKKIEYDNL